MSPLSFLSLVKCGQGQASTNRCWINRDTHFGSHSARLVFQKKTDCDLDNVAPSRWTNCQWQAVRWQDINCSDMKQVTESQCTSKNPVQIYSHWNMLIGTSKIWCWCKVIIYADTNSQIFALTPIRYHIIFSRSALLPTIENALWRHRCITGRGLPSLIALLCIIVLWQSSKPNKEYFGAIQVLRNADGGGGGLIFWKKALRRCNVQRY